MRTKTKAPKKSESITIDKFTVSTEWVSVKIHVSHHSAELLSSLPAGVTRAASEAVHSLAVSIWIHTEPGRSRQEILRSMPSWQRPYFYDHPSGQKLEPLELRMESQEWAKVKDAAAKMEVSVTTFCQAAIHSVAVGIAQWERNNAGAA